MYRGFNLKIPSDLNQSSLETGKLILKKNNDIVKSTLDKFMHNNGSLDGDKLIADWFPEIKSHIFLSHSHKDEEKALIIAGTLFEKFKIWTFIDSNVWGYSNDLLRKIDDKYCLNEDGLNYNYEKRNYSTSHVNLMLSSALNKMIDTSECLFFLNSPNSISTSTEISQKTNSPWIFSEIATSKIIRKQTPQRLKRQTKLFSTGGITMMNESELMKFNIEYELELSHLSTLQFSDLLQWYSTPARTADEALDNLYEQNPINSKFLI